MYFNVFVVIAEFIKDFQNNLICKIIVVNKALKCLVLVISILIISLSILIILSILFLFIQWICFLLFFIFIFVLIRLSCTSSRLWTTDYITWIAINYCRAVLSSSWIKCFTFIHPTLQSWYTPKTINTWRLQPSSFRSWYTFSILRTGISQIIIVVIT